MLFNILSNYFKFIYFIIKFNIIYILLSIGIKIYIKLNKKNVNIFNSKCIVLYKIYHILSYYK